MGFFKAVFSPVTWPARKFGKYSARAAKTSLAVNEQKSFFKAIREIPKGPVRYARELQENRDPWAENAPNMEQFREVLEHWGVEEKDIGPTGTNPVLILIFAAFLGVCGLLILYLGSTLAIKVAGLPVFCLCVFLVLCSYWRPALLINAPLSIQLVFFEILAIYGVFIGWIGSHALVQNLGLSLIPTGFLMILVYFWKAPLLRGLYIQIVTFGVLGLYGAWLLITADSFVVRCNGVPLLFLGVVMIVTKFWRLQVLQRREFVFFKDWFLWGLFSWVGEPTPIAEAEKEKDNEWR